MIRLFLTLLILNMAGQAPAFASDHFPVPKALEPKVGFWIDIFTKYAMHQRIIHDADVPQRIYRVLDMRMLFTERISEEEEERILEEEMERISAILKKLASEPDAKTLTAEEAGILSLFGRHPDRYVLLRAAQNIRVQDGMREPFRDSLVRSGRYLSLFRKIFAEYGIPEEIAYLPHVESSFEPAAYSKYGAAGIWQFTRMTGQAYMRIHRDVDERRDFIISTRAAARLLKTNYRTLKTWPLALMAYNYGLTGIHNAVLRLETRDFMTIIERYRSRRFGFASKNFYAEFIAAVRIAEHPSRYFGKIVPDSPLRFEVVHLECSLSIDSVLARYEVTEASFRDLNRSLSSRIYKRERSIPEDTRLYLPVPTPPEILAYKEMMYRRMNSNQGTDSQSGGSVGFVAGVTRRLGAWIGDLFGGGMRGRNPDRSNATESLDGNPDAIENPWLTMLEERIEEENSETAGVLLGLHRPSLRVSGEMVVVQPEETLGHYAEWLELSAWKIRSLNDLRANEPIRVGQRLKLSFAFVPEDTFHSKRLAYHEALQKSFMENHLLEGSRVYRVREGETLWSVANRRFDVPLWLLLAYNEGKHERSIQPGDEVVVPIVQKREAMRVQTGGM